MKSATKKKLGTTLGGVTAVAAAVGLTAGTFAYFSDSGSSTSEEIRAGELTLNSSFNGVISAENLAPGETTDKQEIKLTNEGDVDGTLRAKLYLHSGSESLAEALQVRIEGSPSTAGEWVDLTDATEASADGFNLGALPAGDQKTFSIQLKLPETGENQNHLQGKSIKEGIKIDLVQGDAPDFQAPAS